MAYSMRNFKRHWTIGATLLGCIAPASAAPPAPYRPAMPGDFPDPFVLQSQGRFLAYATNPDRGHVNVQMAESADVVTWKILRDGGKVHDAMPILPAWAQRGFTWAPEVLKTDLGYVLYFTARDR